MLTKSKFVVTKKYNESNKARGIYAILLILLFRVVGIFEERMKNKWSISFPGGSANSWAELDLNQRRHIANGFTVRPH